MIDNEIIGTSEKHIFELKCFKFCVFGVKFDCKGTSTGYFEHLDCFSPYHLTLWSCMQCLDRRIV